VSDNDCYHVFVVRLKRHVMLGKHSMIHLRVSVTNAFLRSRRLVDRPHDQKMEGAGGKRERTDPYLVNAVL
jgi:hypothetical protein